MSDLSVCKIKKRLYYASVSSVPLYVCERWSLKIEDIRRSLVFDHKCPRITARILFLDQRVTYCEVKRRALVEDGKSIVEIVNLYRLR